MTNIKFNRKEFEKELGKKVTKEIEEKISLFGTPLESISDEEIEVEIFPNRPDLLSLKSYVLQFKSFLGLGKIEEIKINPPEKNFIVEVDKSVEEVRPFTACAIVKNIKFDDEKIKQIIELQEKLHFTLGRNRKKLAIGIYPLEKIKLPIRYEARKPEKIRFVPLDETREMDGWAILLKHPTGKEYRHLLQDLERFPVFVDSKGDILSMPPIINSEKTGRVTGETKDVFIECSGFDFHLLKKTLNIIVLAIGGDVYQMKLKYKNAELTPNFEREKIKVSFENIKKLLGLELKDDEMKKLLEKMGHKFDGSVLVPPWRVDILHEVDIAEDIAIAYGYDKIEPEIPKVSTVAEESKKTIFERKIVDLLVGLRMNEVMNYHLITEREAKIMKVDKIEVKNSKTEFKILRSNLRIPILRVFSENLDNVFPQEIFEVGKVFEKGKTETGIVEKTNLCVGMTPANFTKIKQVLEYLSKICGWNFDLKEEDEVGFIEGRGGAIYFENERIGFIGEIHPQTLRDFNIKMPVAIFELNLDKLI